MSDNRRVKGTNEDSQDEKNDGASDIIEQTVNKRRQKIETHLPPQL